MGGDLTMGWTWSVDPSATLEAYPSLAENAVLRERWPAFDAAARQMTSGRAAGEAADEAPQAGPVEPGNG